MKNYTGILESIRNDVNKTEDVLYIIDDLIVHMGIRQEILDSIDSIELYHNGKLVELTTYDGRVRDLIEEDLENQIDDLEDKLEDVIEEIPNYEIYKCQLF